MRLVHIYLTAYFLLLLGAGLTLWQAGVLGRLPSTWIVAAAVVVIGLGLLLVVISPRSAPAAQS
jgi:hypothetical protein